MSGVQRLAFGDTIVIRRAGAEAAATVQARWGSPPKVLLTVGDVAFTVFEAELLATLPPEVVEVDITRAEALAAAIWQGRGSHLPINVQLRTLAAAVLARAAQQEAAP